MLMLRLNLDVSEKNWSEKYLKLFNKWQWLTYSNGLVIFTISFELFICDQTPCDDLCN